MFSGLYNKNVEKYNIYYNHYLFDVREQLTTRIPQHIYLTLSIVTFFELYNKKGEV